MNLEQATNIVEKILALIIEEYGVDVYSLEMAFNCSGISNDTFREALLIASGNNETIKVIKDSYFELEEIYEHDLFVSKYNQYIGCDHCLRKLLNREDVKDLAERLIQLNMIFRDAVVDYYKVLYS